MTRSTTALLHDCLAFIESHSDPRSELCSRLKSAIDCGEQVTERHAVEVNEAFTLEIEGLSRSQNTLDMARSIELKATRNIVLKSMGFVLDGDAEVDRKSQRWERREFVSFSEFAAWVKTHCRSTLLWFPRRIRPGQFIVDFRP